MNYLIKYRFLGWSAPDEIFNVVDQTSVCYLHGYQWDLEGNIIISVVCPSLFFEDKYLKEFKNFVVERWGGVYGAYQS